MRLMIRIFILCLNLLAIPFRGFSFFTMTNPLWLSGFYSGQGPLQSDPFVGKYNSEGGLFALQLEIKIESPGKYLLYTNGQGPDYATRQGDVLSGTSAGIEFTVRKSTEGLILHIAEQDLLLIKEQLSDHSDKKEASQPPTSNTTKPSKTSEKSLDPFEGIYDLSYQGQIREQWTIRSLGNHLYELESPSGVSQAQRKDNKLSGFDSANNLGFEILKNENDLTLSVSGLKLSLINRKPLPAAADPKQFNPDRRLIGLWSGSSSLNSSGGVGSASMAFGQDYVFKADGTYEYRSYSVGGGADWSASSNGDVERGRYQVIKQSQDGGTVKIGARQFQYTFFDNQYQMKMGNTFYRKK